MPFKVTLAGTLLDAADELSGALDELTGVLEAMIDEEDIAEEDSTDEDSTDEDDTSDTAAALLEAGTSATEEFAALELTAVLEGDIELTATLDGALLLAGASLLAARDAARLLAATEAGLLEEAVALFLSPSPPHPTNNAANNIPAKGLILTLIVLFPICSG